MTSRSLMDALENILQAAAAASADANAFQLDDESMTLRLNMLEIHRALALKEAVEASPELENLSSDFEYVQYALTHPTNQQPAMTPMSTLLDHVARMQAFRHEYQIQETPEQGAQLMDQLSQLQPGCFVSVQYLPASGNCIAINDLAAFFPGQLDETPQKWKLFVQASYYRFQAMSPHFQAIRQGMANLFECEGASFANFDSSFHERLIHELYMSYPKRHKEMFFLNSPMIINMAYALWKKYMTNNMKDTFHLGYKIEGFEGHRIDELFKVPDEETARQHMIQQVQTLLQTRYRNEQSFQLPNISATDLWQRILNMPPVAPPPIQPNPDNGNNNDMEIDG